MEEEQDQEQVALEELGETREVESQKNDQPDDIKGARFHTGWNETVAPITGVKLVRFPNPLACMAVGEPD